MATVFPKKRLQDNEILDIDDTNNAFRDMSQEAGNALGEHNWKQNAFGAADLDPVHALVATSTYQESDRSGSSFDATSVLPVDSHSVEQKRTWEEVTNLTITITTGNSLVWIMASLQYSNPFWYLAAKVELCLAHNSAPLTETVTGTGDLTNDQVSHGILAGRCPVVMDALLPLSPGSHTFTVLVRSDPHYDGTAGWNLYDSLDNRELIVLEMK